MSVLRLGVGGPVGSGKTALVAELCRRLGPQLELAAVTNDIFTREDAEFLLREGVLPPERVEAVETGGCPHTAIRDDVSMNLLAVERLERRLPGLALVFVESGGDKVPRKGGPGVTRSELLVVNKVDLAPLVGADLGVMERDAARLREGAPTLFASVRHGDGMEAITAWVRDGVRAGGFAPARSTARGDGHHAHHHHDRATG